MQSESIIPRVLLIGCGPTALTAFESLAERTTVVGLVRDHDPLDPGSDPVCRRAAELGVPIASDISVRGIDQLLDQLRPDCVVVSSYNRVLPARVVAKTRFVNVHYVLVPRYRGWANVNWAVINGDFATGISIHVLSPDLDGGNILFQEPVTIESTDTASSLYEKLNALQREHLGAAVIRHLHGDDGYPQAAHEATYGCSRLPQDGEIDWAQSTQRVYDLIRALTPPYPGAFTFFEGIPINDLACGTGVRPAAVRRADSRPRRPRLEARRLGRDADRGRGAAGPRGPTRGRAPVPGCGSH